MPGPGMSFMGMGPMGWGVTGAALGAVGGFLSGKKQAEKADDRYEMSRDALLRQIGNTRLAYNKSEGLLKGNLAGIGKGYGEAKANLSGFGNAARANAMGLHKQEMAGLSQRLASSGLSGTTVVENAQRGIYSDTSRRLAEIDEQVGSMLANLSINRAGAMSGARSDLANFYAQRNQAEIYDREQLINLWLGSIPQANNPAAGIGQLGGSMGQMMLLQQMMGGGGIPGLGAGGQMTTSGNRFVGYKQG
jgi:hypothetical protein